MLNYLAVVLISLATSVLADTSYDSTTTVTVTPAITMTTTIGYIEEIFETAYIYTNSYGSLTTSTATGSTEFFPATGILWPELASSATNDGASETGSSTSVSTTLEAAASVATSNAISELRYGTSSIVTSSTSLPSYSALSDVEKAIAESTSAIPYGEYSTSTSATTTTFQDGSSAVIEYVVLYTQDC